MKGIDKGLKFCVLFCILAGCATIRQGPEVKTPLDTRSILATLKMRYDLVDTLRTLVTLKIESFGKGEELRGYLNYEKPDKLRVDGMGPFNEPRVIALTVGNSLQIYFVAENELIKGELSDSAIKEVFNVDLRVSDVRSSIFANPFLDGNIGDLEIEDYGDRYLIRRSSARDGCREEISISAKDTIVSKWRVIDVGGRLLQEVTFSKYKEIGGILRPLRAVISRPNEGTVITIESINPEINVKLTPDIFALPIPPSAKVFQLSELKGTTEVH